MYNYLTTLNIAGETVIVETGTSSYTQCKYLRFELENGSYKGNKEAMAVAARLVKVLENLDQISDEEIDLMSANYSGDSVIEAFREYFEEALSYVSEYLEVELSYQLEGRSRTYTPVANWESSSSCEWETSAEYGVDFGWDV